MARLRIPATKSNLIRIREELRFAAEGKDLLTQKREVLVMELMRLQDDSEKVRQELDDLLLQAYGAFTAAVIMEGFDSMERLALAVPEAEAPKIRERSVMGVVVPIVEEGKEAERPAYGIGEGSAASDRAVRLFEEVRRKLCEAVEIETAIYRLAAETRKTLRRERALEIVFIPEYGETLRFLQESLEERDRESFYQLKLLKGGEE